MPSLHNYQQRAVDWIIDHPSAGLMLAMGLGKTASTLTAIEKLVRDGDVFSVLVVAPKRVAEHTWTQERDKWAPTLSMTVVTGDQKERMRCVMSPTQVHVISRDNLCWLVEQYGKKFPYDMLVIDESSSFKNPQSKRFKALKKVRKEFSRVVLLTGTPAPNSLLELWAQLFLLDGGERLGRTFTVFKQAHFDSDYMGWKLTLRKGSESAIHAKISDICMSMTAEDYLTLPERIANVIEVVLSPNEMAKYKQLARDYVLPASPSVITAANAAVLCGKLQQLASGEIYDEERNVITIHSQKIEALSEIIDAAQCRPVLVFYQFQHERDRILAAIKGAEELDVPKFMRGEQLVAIAHPASAGHGLNLQSGSSEMVWYSVPWSLELYQQACARLHRQGQTKTVVIHHIIGQETIDQDVMAALKDKATTQDRLIDALKRRISHE